jgi:tagaturonate epimerase
MSDGQARLGTYSLGVGDRFAHQAKAQLQAFQKAAAQGVQVVPVWNKSNREHDTVHSQPESVRTAADAAVLTLGWDQPYFVDADHITMATVERFLAPCDFFTLDVADAIGQPPAAGAVEGFLARHPELVGDIVIAGIEEPIWISREAALQAASHYLHAVAEAGRIYRHVEACKGAGASVTEVSMDETAASQSPAELLLILAALADEAIPVQTIAPKFTGRFNKGVDYVGDAVGFEREFSDDVAVIAHAVKTYSLPENLKLSVHSGSDKFSIFPAIHRVVRRSGAGVHVKTSGTTWLEELIGLAEADGDGLQLAKDIYAAAYPRREELCAPYASVIDIDPSRLPAPAEVQAWTAEQFTAALRHDRSNPAFSLHVRQLLHVGYKIAASMGDRYTELLEACEPSIARSVTANLYERHIVPLFIGQ